MPIHDSTAPVPGAETAVPAAPAQSGCPFSRAAGMPAQSLADTLKERTKEAHARAERHPLQGRMVSGTVTRAEYAAWLGQMLHIWRAVDAGLSAAAQRDPRLAAMLKPDHAQAARVAADLEFLGFGGANAPALPATSRLLGLISRGSAAGPGVVGVWYVLEGSTNGGRFIAKALGKGLGLTGSAGLSSIDPYGERQREHWQAWRAALDAQAWSQGEREEIVERASDTFGAIHDVMQDMTSTT